MPERLHAVQNVVWEKLDDLMGNTQFLKADFTPYGSTSLSEQVSDAADLVQAAFAGVAPTKAHASSGAAPCKPCPCPVGRADSRSLIVEAISYAA